MTSSTHPSPADSADRFLQLIVFSMFLMAILFGLSVAGHFVTEPVSAVLDGLQVAVAVTVIVLVLGAIIWKTRRLPASMRTRSELMEGFLQGAFQRALAKSWGITFVVLALSQALDNLVLSRLPEMPAAVLLQAVLVLMLLSLCGAFVLYSRDGSSGLESA